MTEIELQVVAIRPGAKDMATIVLRRRDGEPLEYQAGQFLTFLFSFGERKLRRSYSFVSTPGVDAFAAVSVKRVVNGEVSRYLLGHLREGDVLRSLPPSGKFVLEPESDGPLLFIAAGSGMAPVYSLIKAANLRSASLRSASLRSASLPPGSLAQGNSRPGSSRPARMVLITQNHDPASIPFRVELGRMVEAGRLEWISLLSSEGVRLSNGLLEEILVGLDLAEGWRCYLCGPPAFMRMATFTLRWMGVADGQIKRENFTVEYVPPPPLLRDTGERQVVVRAGANEYIFATAWPSTILQSALNRNIALPYSCKGGRCSTCVVRCVSGRVKMSINEVLTEEDLRAGLILTCVGYAETDLILELGG